MQREITDLIMSNLLFLAIGFVVGVMWDVGNKYYECKKRGRNDTGE